MTFSKIHSDTNCNCLENDSFEDCVSLFGIKTNKKDLREVDFKSNYEKAKDQGKDLELSACDEICSHKGKSCSMINTQNKTEVLDIYRKLFPSTPKYKPYMIIVRWKEKAGLIKHSPLSSNLHHHDFYKCDDFTLTHVEVSESILLSDV